MSSKKAKMPEQEMDAYKKMVPSTLKMLVSKRDEFNRAIDLLENNSFDDAHMLYQLIAETTYAMQGMQIGMNAYKKFCDKSNAGETTENPVEMMGELILDAAVVANSKCMDITDQIKRGK